MPKSNQMDLKTKIETAWNDRSLLKDDSYQNAVREVIEEVDKGRLRVAAPQGTDWVVNEWVKQAILMYCKIWCLLSKNCGTHA